MTAEDCFDDVIKAADTKLARALFDYIVAEKGKSLKLGLHQRRWTTLSSILSACLPWWKSQLTYLIEEEMYNAKSGRRVLDSFSKYCPCGAVSGHEFECILHNEMKASLSASPTYDATRHLLSYGYDNIQHIKHVKATESGASKKKRLVEVRTTRVVLKFLNPKFAKLQLDYKLNPKFMSDKFPLNEVSPEVIDMSEKVNAESEYRTSDIQYLLNEIWFGVKKAVAFVEKNGSLWLADLRGAELINHMSEQSKQQSSYKEKCDKCGEARIYNRFGWCRECGSILVSASAPSHRSLALFYEPLHLLTGSRIWWRY